MFRATKSTEEADSDSDWDSLSGGAEPRSDNEPSPTPHPPTSLNTNSTHIQTPNVKNTSTPVKSNVKSAPKTATTTNLRPGKMYGKSPGVTTFVDRGDYNDSTADRRQKLSPIPVDSNSNRISSNVGSRRQENALEMNELDLNPVRSGHTNMGFHRSGDDNPPYDFKDALPKQDTRGGRPEQKQHKMKKAYIRNQTPDPANTLTPRLPSDHSWDNSDQEEEDGPGIFPSTSPRMSNHKQQANKSFKGTGDIQEYAIDVDIPDDEACCVPYQKKKGNGYTYMFHHGKFQYFSVVPEWREPYMKTIGERTERWLTYFWQEFFGTIGLLVDFGLIFLLELIKFTFRKVLVRLLVGFIIVFGDHLLKPVLAALFNSFLQPSLSFLWNSFVGLRNAIQPLLDITQEVVSQATSLLKGFRLFELNWRPVLDTNANNSRVSQQCRIQEL
ncbi:uncharacterized protein LOC116302208 [Actinia tenebrosa]|uniref:Uncharacterized protein LOC116302208 n=1 Tax=Actinia tenebrosa TaxID=6105 RepID=A0A6P8ILK7_ACTTE|nr:uncharacterized protein LOC116302208 [Actinia tenebrosa]